jgi:hypothetical protein
VAERGEDGRKGWDEDMSKEAQESTGSSGGIIVKLLSSTKDGHSLLEGIWPMRCCAVDSGSYNQKPICKVLMSSRRTLSGRVYDLINFPLSKPLSV